MDALDRGLNQFSWGGVGEEDDTAVFEVREHGAAEGHAFGPEGEEIANEGRGIGKAFVAPSWHLASLGGRGHTATG